MVAREPEKPRIKRIYVRELTPESLGNATGIGLADFVHRAVVDRMDRQVTNMNCLTSLSPEKARVPIICESDREALDLCFETIGLTDPDASRVIRIRNTLQLSEADISSALRQSMGCRADLELIGGPAPMEFDAGGKLGPMLSLEKSAEAR